MNSFGYLEVSLTKPPESLFVFPDMQGQFPADESTESSANHLQATLPAAGDSAGHLPSHVAKSGFVGSLCFVFAGGREMVFGWVLWRADFLGVV